MDKYKIKCLQGSDIFDDEKPQTREEILKRFKMWFDEEIESFKGKIKWIQVSQYNFGFVIGYNEAVNNSKAI